MLSFKPKLKLLWPTLISNPHIEYKGAIIFPTHSNFQLTIIGPTHGTPMETTLLHKTP